MAVGWAVLYFLIISSSFVIATLLFCAAILIFDISKKYRHIPGPGMLRFLWGNYGILTEQTSKISMFQDLFNEFGVIVLYWKLYKPVVTLEEEDTYSGYFEQTDFKDGLTNGDLSTLFDQRFVGRGAQLLCTGPSTDSTFKAELAKRQLKNFNNCCDNFVKMLKSMATSDERVEIKMADQFDKLAVDVIAKAVFGIDNNCMENPDQPLYKALCECQNAINWSVSNPFHKWDISSYDYQNDLIEAVKYLRDYGKKLIDRRRTEIENEEDIEEDYLTWMIATSDRDRSITLDDMLDQFVGVFIAGQGQLSSVLSFILLELLKHPNIEEKIYEEYINSVTANSQVSFEHLHELKLTSCVVRETLRLHPPVLAVFTKMKSTGRLYSYEIPEKTQIQMIPAIIQKSPKKWKDPLEFLPERFVDVDNVRISTLFPYALRSHNYVNGYFVECMVKAVLPHLLQKFKFVMNEEQDLSSTGEVFSVPKDGVLCSLSVI